MPRLDVPSYYWSSEILIVLNMEYIVISCSYEAGLCVGPDTMAYWNVNLLDKKFV